jgi:hypothetical protein
MEPPVSEPKPMSSQLYVPLYCGSGHGARWVEIVVCPIPTAGFDACNVVDILDSDSDTCEGLACCLGIVQF